MEASPTGYAEDTASVYDSGSETGVPLSLRRVPERTRALTSTREGEAPRYTGLGFELDIQRGETPAPPQHHGGGDLPRGARRDATTPRASASVVIVTARWASSPRARAIRAARPARLRRPSAWGIVHRRSRPAHRAVRRSRGSRAVREEVLFTGGRLFCPTRCFLQQGREAGVLRRSSTPTAAAPRSSAWPAPPPPCRAR